MKQLLLSLAALVLLQTSASASERLLCISTDWTLSARGGLEQRYDNDFGWRADLGLSPFGLITSDAFFVAFLLPRERRWRVNLLGGIPYAGMPLSFNAGMISLGASCSVGLWVNDRMSLDLRLGFGFPFFFEKDKEVVRDIHFPLGLWPDAAFSVNIRL